MKAVNVLDQGPLGDVAQRGEWREKREKCTGVIDGETVQRTFL